MRVPCRHCARARIFESETCFEHLPDREEWTARMMKALFEGRGKGACLEGVDLAGESLAGLFLELADFRDAVLAGVDLTGAAGERASFLGADLSGARLGEARLQVANFRRARCDDASFRGARLNGATFNHARMRGADLTASELVGTSFRGADLRETSFRDARMLRATISAADIAGADFTGAEWRDGAAVDVVGWEAARGIRRDTGGIITTDALDQSERAPRPSEMRWRHWTEAEPPASSPDEDDD